MTDREALAAIAKMCDVDSSSSPDAVVSGVRALESRRESADQAANWAADNLTYAEAEMGAAINHADDLKRQLASVKKKVDDLFFELERAS